MEMLNFLLCNYRICSEVISGIVTKCLNASKARTKELGNEIIMMYIEIDKPDIVQVGDSFFIFIIKFYARWKADCVQMFFALQCIHFDMLIQFQILMSFLYLFSMFFNMVNYLGLSFYLITILRKLYIRCDNF